MAKRRANRTSSSRPYEVLFQMVIGKWISQALGTIVEIGVPDQLAKGARRCSDIAREAGVSEDGIYRLLRALASVGLFVESSGRRFKLTGMGQLLRSDHPESLAGYARFIAHDSTWRPWGQLGYSVKTGMPAFDHVFNVPIFEHLSQNPEVAAVFDDAMTSISNTEARATSDAYDFKGVETLMDVAGGHGLLLATVLRRHKKMRGRTVRSSACCGWRCGDIRSRWHHRQSANRKRRLLQRTAIGRRRDHHEAHRSRLGRRLGDADSSSMPSRARAARQGADCGSGCAPWEHAALRQAARSGNAGAHAARP